LFAADAGFNQLGVENHWVSVVMSFDPPRIIPIKIKTIALGITLVYLFLVNGMAIKEPISKTNSNVNILIIFPFSFIYTKHIK
jgi:hypothetical protein